MMDVFRENRARRKAILLRRRSERTAGLGAKRARFNFGSQLRFYSQQQLGQHDVDRAGVVIQGDIIGSSTSGMIDKALDLGYHDHTCTSCGAIFWYEERICKANRTTLVLTVIALRNFCLHDDHFGI